MADFPAVERETTLAWQEAQQNFVITGVGGRRDEGGTAQHPVPVSVNTSVSGYLETRTDMDYFEIAVPAAGTLTIEVTGVATVLELLDSTGRVLARSEARPASSQLSRSGAYRVLSNHGQTTRLDVQISGPGTYSIRLAGLEGATGSYDVTVQHEVGEVTEPDEPGETFTDPLASGGRGPQMVEIPAGSFRMGCLHDVGGGPCSGSELPMHRVDVPQFALSKYEVTSAEWNACVDAGGCNEYRQGQDNRPVSDVSWDDAQAYATWLSGQTGDAYRLPSEAEWEYAARAGATTKYHWGNTRVGQNRANCEDCGSRWDDRQTAPVGQFAPNAFGLYDMHGNVSEWVEDCANRSYTGAPTDGSAWGSGRCIQRLRRGGAFNSGRLSLRAASRYGSQPHLRGDTRGFRVARSLP